MKKYIVMVSNFSPVLNDYISAAWSGTLWDSKKDAEKEKWDVILKGICEMVYIREITE